MTALDIVMSSHLIEIIKSIKTRISLFANLIVDYKYFRRTLVNRQFPKLRIDECNMTLRELPDVPTKSYTCDLPSMARLVS